jgi:hypothetical protein
MDPELVQNFFAETHKHWIGPELTRRFGENIPVDFKIHRCLVRLPAGRAPIVEFNEEFGFTAEAKISDGEAISDGQDVNLHHVEKVKQVQPICYEGKRVPFVLLLSHDGLWTMLFDFSPGDEPLDSATPWSFSDRIAAYIEERLAARAAALSSAELQQLRTAGLWPAPCLLPYPLSHICKHVRDGNPDAAEALLVRHCTVEFLTQLLSNWASVDEFAARERLLREALDAHSRRQYALSIYSLLPQIEGVMTDWLHRKSGLPEIKFRQESKTGQFLQVISSNAKLTSTGKSIVAGTMDFILNGPVLEKFAKWNDPVSDAFPGRNVVSHGKYEQDMLSEGSSIKVFLLLDTLWHMLKL